MRLLLGVVPDEFGCYVTVIIHVGLIMPDAMLDGLFSDGISTDTIHSIGKYAEQKAEQPNDGKFNAIYGNAPEDAENSKNDETETEEFDGIHSEESVSDIL